MSGRVMWKETLMVWAFAFVKIPMLWIVRPRIVALDAEQTRIRVKLKRRTRNHVGAMYLAAMVAGADIASALIAMHQLRLAGVAVTPIFKDVRAEFFKRAERNVDFVCTQGAEIASMVRELLDTGERVTRDIKVYAYVTGESEPVAEFVMGLSLKKKKA